MDTELVSLLKKKGTGPTMSKSLDQTDLERLTLLLSDPEQSLTTLSTLLTAIMTLPPTSIESEWIQNTKSNVDRVPVELRWLISQSPTSEFQHIILECIRGKVLPFDDAYYWLNGLFLDYTDWEKSAFLEGLRLRRETHDENRAALAVCLERTHRIATDFPEIIDIANAYDGYNRTPYLTPFVAAVLAAVGVPAVLHGIDEISPKRGVNTYKLLKLAGKNPIRKMDACRSDLQRVGWAYTDQTVFSPEVAALKSLRVAMVKRPVLATVEKLCVPVTGHWTGLVTGYTHPPYKEKTINLVKQLPIDVAVVVRGVEGSTQLPLDRRAPEVIVRNDWVRDDFIRPESCGEMTVEIANADELGNVEQSLAIGVDALCHNSSQWASVIRYQAVQILNALQPPSLFGVDLEARVRVAIESGEALRRWETF